MEELSGSSYSPSIHSGSEGNPEVSFVSTRSHCSQMSISSQGSTKDISDAVIIKHRKGVGRLSKRFHLSQARKLRTASKKGASTTCISIPAAETPMPVATSDTNILINLGTMQSILNSMARCALCENGKLSILVKGISHGCSSFISITCTSCDSANTFWSSGSRIRGIVTVGDSTIKDRSQLIYSSLLAGRIMGIGWAKLHLYHSFLNIPGPMSKRNFTVAQSDLLVAARVVANESMEMAVNQLRVLHSVDISSQYVEVIGTFDGAYQQRSGKSGGGFSRYCFAAAISAETGKVLSYDVACNSCAYCSTLDNKLRDSVIPLEEHQTKMAIHKPVCSAEYSDYSSVQLESAIAPKVIADALSRGIIFSAIVSDGDNKTHDVLAKAGIYNEIRDAPTIDRFECIAHVAKRLKSNLHKRQEKVLKTARADKAAMSRTLSKKGFGKKEVSKKVDPLFKGMIQRSSKARDSWDSNPAQEIRHLSLALCGQIASYYRLAVQRNAGDLPSIQAAIKAIPLHLSATNENAEMNHRFCPYSSDSWCRYQHAIFNSDNLPSHPNYLGADATSLIQDLFQEFGYDSEDFVRKISQGLSSNHNEAIHSLLFTMVHKTDAIGKDVMDLGSALAVIRYNEGFAGIKRLCQKLSIDVNPRLIKAFESLDVTRARHRLNTVRDQRKRYLKKQRRGRKTSKQLAKGSAPYSSGEYTGAKAKFDSESSSDEGMGPGSPLAIPAATSSTDSSLEPCSICFGTEANGLVGIGIGLKMPDEDVVWVQCDTCEKWYHLLCLDIEDPEDLGAEFHCPDC